MTDNIYWIWFQTLFGVGTRRAELLMNYFDSPKSIFDGIAEKNRVAGMLTREELDASEAAMQRAGQIERRTLKKGVDIVTPDHPDYPELLGQIYSKPAVLYVKGDLRCLKGKLAIAVVGARKHTAYGKQAASWIAKGLAEGGAVVVSGLAHGIDTESHTAALDAGGKSIGVLGCGIDIDYPKGSAPLKRRLCENGAVVSEFPLGVEPRPSNFPIRNRIISGICHGTVVVEADLTSGSLLTAQHALDQGRDVFAVPGSVFSSREQGTHRLIREGAKLTESARDVFDEYEYLGFCNNIMDTGRPIVEATTVNDRSPSPNIKKTQPKTEAAPPEKLRIPDLPEGVSRDAQTVFGAIGYNTVNIEEISDNTQLDMAAIMTALTELEIYGLIQGYPGRRFGTVFAANE